ncbi:hypothetical protein G6F68_009766 [Rhizopus microsporus]|nr:hypothetical protein G6F68_009766 [Rhizopus microsporus]
MPLQERWPLDAQGRYDLWLLGPNGFHRHFQGAAKAPALQATVERADGPLRLQLRNLGDSALQLRVQAGAYAGHMPEQALALPARAETSLAWDATPTAGWYDLQVSAGESTLRLAGRAEDGRPGTSDPAMGSEPLRFEHEPKPRPSTRDPGTHLRLSPRWPARPPHASRPRRGNPAPVLCALPVLSPRQAVGRRPLETAMNQALIPFDTDPLETREWRESLEAVMQAGGRPRAHYLIDQLSELDAQQHGDLHTRAWTAYVNSIPPERQPAYPGDLAIERRLNAMIRWNAMVMVLRAGRHSNVGGPIATYQTAAVLYDVGFDHFFRGRTDTFDGDMIYIQGHSAPGIYGRAYVEGRIDPQRMDNFRREAGREGLSSYPHPRLMPEFWQHATCATSSTAA